MIGYGHDSWPSKVFGNGNFVLRVRNVIMRQVDVALLNSILLVE